MIVNFGLFQAHLPRQKWIKRKWQNPNEANIFPPHKFESKWHGFESISVFFKQKVVKDHRFKSP